MYSLIVHRLIYIFLEIQWKPKSILFVCNCRISLTFFSLSNCVHIFDWTRMRMDKDWFISLIPVHCLDKMGKNDLFLLLNHGQQRFFFLLFMNKVYNDKGCTGFIAHGGMLSLRLYLKRSVAKILSIVKCASGCIICFTW